MEASAITTFYFDNVVIGTTTSTVSGTAEMVFAIPDISNTGTHIIKATAGSFAVASATVLIAAPALSLSPATGAVGMKVTVTGTNFYAGGAVTFLLNGSDMTMDTSVTANGAGSFLATFTMPDTAAGAQSIKASSSSFLSATATYTVATPTLTISPITGTRDLKISTSGTGFRANSTVHFFINEEEIDKTATTNSFGAFRNSFSIPNDAHAGAQTIRAQTDSINSDDATYTVIASTVTANALSGVPGTMVNFYGLNFNSNATVSVK
jgi:hypothetical protein